jgi:coproporphyrinogen III oxidase
MESAQIFDEAAASYRELQDLITTRLEQLETNASAFFPEGASVPPPARFREDAWSGEQGGALGLQGGGRTRVLENGRVFERAGVNFSDVHGSFSPELAASLPGESREFRASGISLVLHPRNPQVPTVHANFRVIRRGPPDAIERMWFGGGADLTPYVLYPEDARHFHGVYREVAREHSAIVDWAQVKRACDEYFRLPHRNEARGVGGFFYDYRDQDPEAWLAFSRAAGAKFLDSYAPIVERRVGLAYGERERSFQLWRRGRYVEFNLIYDRGTLFGLRTGGRIESILMSLPPLVAWQYDFQPEPGGPEEELLNVLRFPVEWV